MQRYTDIFIKRPVLATVISLLILVLGLRSLGLLPIQQYPAVDNAVVTINTFFTGANPEVVSGFITTPLENSIAQANGIDYITSQSTLGNSVIQATLRLNYDPSKALSEINTKVNAVLNQLPQGSQQPTLKVALGQTIDAMYMGFYSNTLADNQITDYLTRIVQPKLQAIPGVQTAEILGDKTFAMRVWLDPLKLAAYGVTAADVSHALADNDYIAAVGRTDGQMFTVNLTASTGLSSVEAFKHLIIKSTPTALVRLADVADVSLGAENYDTNVLFDNKPSVYIGIKIAPGANLLTVISAVRQAFPEIQQQLPKGLNGEIVYDSTLYVNNSIKDVVKSLLEALIIVTAVIYCFLGTLRSVLIPVVTIPLSLIGAFLFMLLFGFSINLLTLLALVLAIGLVVDDAIIVVENVYRYMESGMSTLDAALQGARDLASPILAMTVVLIAVFVPIGFMGGLTGALFTEFAFTLAGAVTVSAIVALTLSPMMCGAILQPHNQAQKKSFVDRIDQFFEKLKAKYSKGLSATLDNMPVVLVFTVVVLVSIYFLYALSKSELAPQEDQGIILAMTSASANASLTQTQLYTEQVYRAFSAFPETAHVFQVNGLNGLNTSIAGMVLLPWDQRKRTTMALQPLAQEKLDHIAGAQNVAFQNPSLPGGGGGLPIQFVIQTTEPFAHLNEVAQAMLTQAQASGQFVYSDLDLKIDKSQAAVDIDRDKAAQLGVSMKTIGDVLASALSGGYINYFNFAGRSYQVIPQMIRQDRLNAIDLSHYYVNTATNQSIPLSTLVHLKNQVVPESLNHFQQLNAVTLSAVPAPGISMGEALHTLQNIAKQVLPQGYSIDYAAQSRQFMQESDALMLTFFFALIIIYLVLAALFESFRDPLIILISVPLSICGAMIFICLGVGGATLNIYTEVGLVTLIGLISKQGILIVEFANDLQKRGHSKRQAVEEASAVRLRPILMTTAAMVLGVVPLIIATGAGAVSRFNIGLVIAAGIAIGTLFTVYVVPAMYMLLANDLSEK